MGGGKRGDERPRYDRDGGWRRDPERAVAGLTLFQTVPPNRETHSSPLRGEHPTTPQHFRPGKACWTCLGSRFLQSLDRQETNSVNSGVGNRHLYRFLIKGSSAVLVLGLEALLGNT